MADISPDLPRSYDWVTRLVKIDSTSRLSNLPVIEAIADEARRLGVEPTICPSPDPEKANLLITVPAADGSTSGGVALSGHSDVVPVDGQDWSSDPFEPEVRDGKLYGRGTCDMKGFIGVALTKLPEMLEAKLREPIHLVVSYDEEVGCLGGDQIVQDIHDHGLNPRACIVGEPSSMRVITGHKSISLATVTFHGKAAHSSLTAEGVNAIEYAARLVSFVRGIADGWKQDGPFDEAFPIRYSTASVNLIEGGNAVNTIPASCSVTFEFRALVDVDPHAVMERVEAYARELEAEMQAEHPETSVDFTIGSITPGLDTDPGADVVSLGQALGGTVSDEKVTYGTEAGQFSGGGIETVVCGPGDIAQAHKADEFIELDQLRACEDFMDTLIQHLSA